MAEKLSWSELRRALASRAGVSEKEANAFLSAFNAQLVEVLKTDKQVKINGLGTFKLLAVAPRKSVNVTTGEEIIIDGYNKIVFAPEAGVKELVEKTSVVSSTEDIPADDAPQEAESAVVDPIKKLGEQAEEIVDILGELGQSPKEEEPVVEEPEEPVAEEPAEPEPEIPAEPEPVIPEPEPEPVAPKPEPVVVPEPAPVIPEPVVAPTPEPKPQPEPEQPKKKKKKSHFFRDTLICMVILIALALVGYFFFRDQIFGLIKEYVIPRVQATWFAPKAESVAVATDSVVQELALIPEGDIPQEQILDEFLAISEGGDETQEAATQSINEYKELIKIEPMHEASRLTWMSKRFYGDKRYWPYLYDANRDRIVNPSKIEVGTPIRVPKLTPLQLDTTNAETKKRLEALRIEAEAACRK
ncbi:MAG: HU family DNA-binding protein [Paludibacteraceae bacterium]|nr:HU family DNA-binding protein [Paludibacteraceae bacterium]